MLGYPDLQRVITSNLRRVPAASEAGDLQYGGRTLEAAAGFWMGCKSRGTRELPLRPSTRGAVAFVRVLLGLPRIEVRLSDETAGRRIGEHLRVRVFGVLPKHRVAQGVLAVPPSMGAYLSGRSRQAVRTNTARAARAGIAVSRLVTLEARRDAVDRYTGPAPALVDREWRDEWWRRAAEDGRVWLAASNPDGQIQGLLVATVDLDWAMLEVAIARQHCTRWLLQKVLLQHLVDSGVRYMFTGTGNVLSLGPSLRHIQRLLGYVVANLAVSANPPSAPSAPAWAVAAATNATLVAAREQHPEAVDAVLPQLDAIS